MFPPDKMLVLNASFDATVSMSLTFFVHRILHFCHLDVPPKAKTPNSGCSAASRARRAKPVGWNTLLARFIASPP